MRKDILIFKIESIIDHKSHQRYLEQYNTSDTLPELGHIEQRAIKAPFHQIVAISYAHLLQEPGEQGTEIILRRIASGCDKDSSERDILEAFFKLITSRSPHLISFNGNQFDIPVLKYRAMQQHLSCPAWFATQDHWNQTDSCYGKRHHSDLAEVLSDHSSSARCNIGELSNAFSIPHLSHSNQHEIDRLFEQKDITAIRNHCETEVCSILLIFLRWKLFQGQLNHQSYARSTLGVHNYLESEAETQPHLANFLQTWQQLEALKN